MATYGEARLTIEGSKSLDLVSCDTGVLNDDEFVCFFPQANLKKLSGRGLIRSLLTFAPSLKASWDGDGAIGMVMWLWG